LAALHGRNIGQADRRRKKKVKKSSAGPDRLDAVFFISGEMV
jgi:hypothetical protein